MHTGSIAPETAPRPFPWHGALAPLNLLGYAMWLAIVLQVVDRDALARGEIHEWIGLGCLLVFLVLFVAHACTRRVLLAMAEGVVAVIAIWALRNGYVSVLIVMVAAHLVAATSPWRAAAYLLPLNFVMVLSWLQWTPWQSALLSFLPVLGFEAFAALTAHFAVSAERARRELAGANLRLVGMQSLLDEAARAEERLKLSRELHDVAGHKLTALKLNLERVARQPAATLTREVDVARQLAAELLEDIRAVVGQLRRHDGIDLRDALESMAARMPGPRYTLHLPEHWRPPSVAIAAALLRCAQEAMVNAVRHGNPTTIAVEILRRGDAMELKVLDDGGVRPVIRFGNGLTGMRERLAELGGDLTVTAAPHGVELMARLPLVT
jgi:signal transduction histidine kinase